MVGSLSRRAPGWVNLGGAIVLLLVVVSLALRAQNASPPAIAEFAPQAQQIKQAPQEQTSKFGSGQGGAASGAFQPSPSPSPPPAGLPQGAVVNNCVGDPPRQIEDPQSPPCIPYWVGNNGGATSKGVSPSEVTVVYTQSQADAIAGQQQMVDFFNHRFEMYGRKLKMVDDSGNPNGGSETGQRAEADLEDQQNQPFAALSNNSGGGITYSDQLAKDHIISVFSRPYLTEPYMASRAPYIWSYPMAADTLERTFGQWGCDRLKGGAATHAGLGLAGKPRVFALLWTTESIDVPVDDQPMLQTLANCGIQLAYTSKLYDGNSSGQAQGNYQAAIVSMKSKGVTSVFCLCERQDLGYLGQYSDNQQYYPEWLMSSYVLNDDNAEIRSLDPSADQKAHTFGISVVPMQRQFADHPSTWADPSLPYNSDSAEGVRDWIYRDLLLIASGIQMAGPHLTPQNFQRGLQGAAFPNPDTGLHAGHVGFAGGSHAMTVDAAEFWWSNTSPGPYADEGSGGTWCYVGHGARHSLANPWPAGDPFFTPTCDSGNEPGG